MDMDITEVLKSYNSHDFIHNDKSKMIMVFSKLAKFNDTAATFLFQNNEAVCQGISSSKKNEQKWLELQLCFNRLYSSYKSLRVIPLELEMNVIYNMLWWFWIRPQTSSYTTHHLKSMLKSVSHCLIKVITSNGEVVLGQQMCSDDVTSFVNLLKRASDQLLCLKPVACIQLLDIITMTVQVFLQQTLESTAEFMSMMRKIVDQIDLLRLHTEQKKSAGSEEVYFKFGLKRINSTASLKNCRDSIDAFVITSSLVCAMNEEVEQAISCLKGTSEDETCFSFMMNYLKAHCCLMSQHYSEAKLCLAYVMSGQVSPLHLAHYRLLLARLLGVQGDHQSALVQCDAVLASHSAHASLASLAAHLGSQEARKINLTTAELHYLRQLVQSLKAKVSEDNGDFESFEECCLLTLSHQFSVTMLEALYTLARQLYLAGYHVKSLDSFKELLEQLKLPAPETETSLLMPCKSQLVHECILAYIKCNSFPGGEQLCRQLVGDHLPHSGGRGTHSLWEVALYGMEDDVIALLLLSDILTASGNKRKALEELNRCLSALSEWRDQSTSDSESQLCDWLLSRVLLRKAKLSSVSDAVHYFRRALIHKPGDKEVMFHYKQWSLWHPDHESFDPGDAATAITFPVDEIYNLAIRHMLGCNVSEEEWNHLFDRETSNNIIESLFDDDDD